jgi:hypothetical protein
MKQIKDLGEKEVILCTTLEECEAIAELIDEKNGNNCWKTSRDYKEYYFGKFCYNVSQNNFGPLFHYEREEFTIHNAKDFLQETTKQVSNEVKEELQDILKEWENSKFQIPLNVIIRQRLK